MASPRLRCPGCGFLLRSGRSAGTGVDDVPDGRDILFEVLRVGVDGTDKEINDAEYGDPPEGYDFLVTGHESFGRVLEAGSNVQGLQNRRQRGGHHQTARYQHQVFVEVNDRV